MPTEEQIDKATSRVRDLLQELVKELGPCADPDCDHEPIENCPINEAALVGEFVIMVDWIDPTDIRHSQTSVYPLGQPRHHTIGLITEALETHK